MAITQQDILNALGVSSLPTATTGHGQYGDTQIALSADSPLLQYNGQGFLPLAGTKGGYRVFQTAGRDENGIPMGFNHGNDIVAGQTPANQYTLGYTPDYAGSHLAEQQGQAASDKGTMYGNLLAAAIMGGGMAAGSMGYGSASNAFSATGGLAGSGGAGAAAGAAGAAGASGAGSGVNGAISAVKGGMPLSEAATTFGLSDAQMAAVAQGAYGGVGATYGGVGVGSLAGLGAAASASPWYEKLWNVATTPGGTLGKALGSFVGTLATGGAKGGSSGSGTPGGSNSGSGSGSGDSGGSGGTMNGFTTQKGNAQQLAMPEFIKFDSPLGVQYHGFNQNGLAIVDPFAESQQTWNPLAHALRTY